MQFWPPGEHEAVRLLFAEIWDEIGGEQGAGVSPGTSVSQPRTNVCTLCVWPG